MSRILPSVGTEAKVVVSALFENKPPVLVEVRFPSAATSPEWYLFDEEEQLEQLVERLGPGVELHVRSVWDLKHVKAEVCLRK